jgi:hypothetical protein
MDGFTVRSMVLFYQNQDLMLPIKKIVGKKKPDKFELICLVSANE